MPRVDYLVETQFERTTRVQQLEAMFDVPAAEKSRLEWHGDLPIEGLNWNVGLILGPSGCGKSTLLRKVFGEEQEFRWTHPSVIDDFSRACSMEDITTVCSASTSTPSSIVCPKTTRCWNDLLRALCGSVVNPRQKAPAGL